VSNLPILFIGPVRAGKTTVSRLLAGRLSLPYVSLDEIRWNYYRELGYDDSLAKKIRLEGGFLALVFYRQLFDSYAVERVLLDYSEAVIDCGAGVGPYENQLHLERVQKLFDPLPNVFLLLPSPDIEETLRILRERDANPPGDLKFDINAHFCKHPGYRLLAKHILYTKDASTEKLVSEIIDHLG
jgi:hypothetical protein